MISLTSARIEWLARSVVSMSRRTLRKAYCSRANRQEIPLKDAELAAIDDGVAAFEKLLAELSDVPTPAGPTPRQLHDSGLVQVTEGPKPGGGS